ncbi:MAG: hypothetical protein LWW86_11475 [Micrococcales bacterium]|nr:hypothetical protein [Micrococcales bacterium]
MSDYQQPQEDIEPDTDRRDQPQSKAPAQQADSPEQVDAAGPPATGDVVIDAALRDLHDSDPADLDAQLEAGTRVHRTLQGRLSDLQGQ